MTLAHGPVLTSGGKEDPFLPKLLQAINRATSIEMSVSFIQRSGLELIIDALTDALSRQATIAILTSDYLGITDPVALRQLMILQAHGAKTKIFTCQSNQSFHMKSYIFVQNQNNNLLSGCAYIGSNNISKAALTHALEWCLRHDLVQGHDSSDFGHIRQQFSTLFNHPQVSDISNEYITDYIERRKKIKPPLMLVSEQQPSEPTPNEAQSQALAALADSRQNGNKSGLVVLATGMGKTWLAAFDVQQFNAKKVLFVAHREEILLQAERTFSQLLPTKTTSHFNATNKNTAADIVFASIQTLGKKHYLEKLSVDLFDYLIVDEFHHAGASSYRALLAHFSPRFLLGLTATPERTDQADILSLCDNNLVFERNIIDGIEAGILVPFQYHGINDTTVDYKSLPWRNGKFDPKALENQFATKKRADHVFKHWQIHKQQRTLAFCVSKAHADFMATYFNNKGIKAESVHSNSKIRRAEALNMLDSGVIEVLFSVDLFSEGTDLPSIDTILILRPTESKILFLQQLGRGLRTCVETNKTYVSVIDFIGNHISFLNRPMALLQTTNPNEAIKKLTTPQVDPKCLINIDPELINFWRQLKLDYTKADEQYQWLKDDIGHRPTATEFFHSGFDWQKLTVQQGSWFEFVIKQETNNPLTQQLTPLLAFLDRGVEKAKMSKCFKAILLKAFIELDGINTPPDIDALAMKSWHVFKRYPHLWAQDVKATLQTIEADSPKWQKYWLDNPITFLCKQDKADTQAWFSLNEHTVSANITEALTAQQQGFLLDCMAELTDLLLARYSQRAKSQPKLKQDDRDIPNNLSQLKLSPSTTEDADVKPKTKIAFYPELKIACGHFKTGSNEAVETLILGDSIGSLDPQIHFIAPASGHSMDGGKNPIQDGDLLLLERVTPVNAGSITGQIMAIEIQDAAGDNQYLLRKVAKLPSGKYQLKAHNPDYKDLLANENMQTFARFKRIISQDEISQSN
ncbi:DEAD/DEAH box helicase family protein [Shewanella sp.]|uniref:DEAD/DEAH box helicase family protein n=2 Tax=Shewanella sp. TaxID=50422 RepID=UPI0040541F8A